jgi:hypothetical protein
MESEMRIGFETNLGATDPREGITSLERLSRKGERALEQ